MTGAPPGAPPRRFLSSGHASRQATFDRDLTSASSWRGALSGAQVGSEGLPGPGVRDLCAGAAPCSISKTPPEDALIEQDECVLAYVPAHVNNIPTKNLTATLPQGYRVRRGEFPANGEFEQIRQFRSLPVIPASSPGENSETRTEIPFAT